MTSIDGAQVFQCLQGAMRHDFISWVFNVLRALGLPLNFLFGED